MLRVTSKDYNFYQIVAYLKQPTNDTTKLVKSIQTFRSRLSLKWLELFMTEEEPEECMKAVWLILLKMATHDDATVRISIHSAIGGLLFAILPFNPLLMMRSFAEATQTHKQTSRASVAIIAIFLYICHSISPSDLDYFITNAFVIHHFSVDLTHSIQHIPKFIDMMYPLDLQFHQSLLRSLLSSFGRTPNHDFVKSVVRLVSLNPDILIKDLMEFCVSNSLDQTILALGYQILSSEILYPLLKENNYIYHFQNVSLNVISNAESNLSDFEKACGTLSTLVDRFDGVELEELKVKISENTLKEYPKHFQRLLLQLPTPMENLKIMDDDSNSIKCAKINSYVLFAKKNENIDVILSNLFAISQEKLEGDALTALITAFASMFPYLLNAQNDDKMLAKILRTILLTKGQTWLQNSAILKLLLVVGSDLGNKLLLDEFESLTIPLILGFSCSPQDELSSLATSTLNEFVTLKNVEIIKTFLWSINYFEPPMAHHFVILLNAIADSLGTECISDFAGIAGELVVFHPAEPEIAGNAFKFLNKCPFYTRNVPNDVISACIDWITRLYFCITQNNSKISSPLRNEPLPPLISSVETDIVASDIMASRSKAMPLLHCYEFFINLKGILSPYSIVFTKELVKLFPDFIIPLVSKIPKQNIKEFADFPEIVATTLKVESSLKTAAICCDFLAVFGSASIQNQMREIVSFFVKNPKVINGGYLAHFYKYLTLVFSSSTNVTTPGSNPYTEEEKENLLKLIKDRLDPVNLALFQHGLGKFNIELFSEFSGKVEFCNWPLSICSFFKENASESLKANVGQLNSLDFEHFSFYYQNREKFNVIDENEFNKYIENHHHFVEKIEMHYVEKTFSFNVNVMNQKKEGLLKIPSILPQIVDNNVTSFNEPLIKSFFDSSSFNMPQKIYTELLDHITTADAAISALTYANKFQKDVSDDQLNELTNKFEETKNEKLLTLIAKRIKSRDNEKLVDYKLWFDPDSYLKEFKDRFAFKTNNLVSFCKVLSMSPKFDQMELTSFLLEILKSGKINITEIQSSKKILSLLRIVNQVLSLFGRQINKDFVNELSQILLLLQNSDVSLIYNELALIFSLIFNVFDSSPLFNVCENFDKIVKNSAVFIVPQAVSVSRYGKTSQRITKSMLNEQLVTEIPSQRLRAMCALDKVVNCRPYWPLVTSLLPNIIKTYGDFSSLPVFDVFLAKFSTILASDINFESIMVQFSQKILPFLFLKPHSPSFDVFAEAASIATQPIGPPLPIYFQFIDSLISTTTPLTLILTPTTVTTIQSIEPNAAHYYRDFVRWLLKFESDPIRKTDIMLEELANMQKIFACDPSGENSEGLIEALRQPSSEGIIDPTFMLFGKLANMRETPLLQMAVLVNKYFVRASDDEKQKCKEMFESLSDSYEPEKGKAIKLILEGKPFDAVKCQ